MDLPGKVALITGAARIGHVVADELARQGCHIVLTYRTSRDSTIETAQMADKRGVRVIIVKADLSVEADVKRLMAEIKKEFQRLDILVNMASTYEPTPYASLSERDFNRLHESNLKSSLLLSLHAPPLMKGEGRIIHFSDWVAKSGRPRYRDYMAYYTAKAGILGLTEALALELAPGILVNAIAPGPILPPENMKKKELDAVKKATPLKKWGGPIEVAKAVLFLCETDFVTGECIRVDGGRHLE